MENKQIKAFIAVVEQGTITKAAEHLYTTQSSVSKKINALEEEFRIQLFYRGKGYRKAELTPSGKQFLALCRQWQNIKKEADSLHIQREQIHLSIGAIELINSFTFTEHYRRMLLEHPELCIEIHTHHSGEIYHLVANHYVDLGYVYNQQSHNELIVRRTLTIKMPVRICYEIESRFPRLGSQIGIHTFQTELRQYLNARTNFTML